MFNFSNSKKTVVGFSVTPGIGLEAVVYDKNRGVVVNYGRKKVEYNFSQRSIQDYPEFKNALSELVDELHIAPKTYAYLILPNVYFDFTEFPPETSDSEIETALISISEDFYVFKKAEPVLAWCDAANLMGAQRRLAYCAFQKTDVDEIKETFSSVGLQLAGIESAYSATLKGLNLTKKIEEVVLTDASWSALLINTNSFTLFDLEGKNLLECNEIPLAIKSFSTEEAYEAIVSSVSQLLASKMISQLYIISQTDDINAEALKKMMRFDKEVIAIDSNKYSKNSLIEVENSLDFNDAKSLTLSVLGAVDLNSDLGLSLNVLSKDPNASMGVYFNVGGKEITQEFVQGTSVILSVFIALILGGITGAAMFFTDNQEKEIGKLSQNISAIENEINILSKVEEVKPIEEEIDMSSVIDEVAAENVTAINFYDSISNDIPKNVWLTKYYNKNGNKLAVRGIAESIVDIYEYYKNLRIVSPQSDIKLNELKVIANLDGDAQDQDVGKFIQSLAIDKDVDRLYSFVISNTEIATELAQSTGQSEKNYDETDILARPKVPVIKEEEVIEEPSNQMRPAR